MSGNKIRIGLMGFGQIGRQIYQLAAASDDLEIPVISDIGKPDILHYLLSSDADGTGDYKIAGNHLVCPRFRTRMVQNPGPGDTPWDIFDVDLVIDATGQFRDVASLAPHLSNGAPRVLITTWPVSELDRMIVPGINDADARRADRMLSAGSATTAALAYSLKILDDALGVACASVTSVHAFSSDQPVQDYAGSDFRRSRSAAENIIPNGTAAPQWVGQLLPKFAGKISGHALNVPVHKGSMLDLSIVLEKDNIDVATINQALQAGSARFPGVVDCASDPIVSSDIIDHDYSITFDLQGTLKSGAHMAKILGWYESLGHARRLLDVARIYQQLDR